MASKDEELPPSKLGTKAHWDEVYEREVRVFNDVGDEGEVWFGESSVRKMRKWAHDNLPRGPLRILECGSGNGTLLLSFLTSPPSTSSSSSEGQKFSLTGIDYSPLAADLAAGVEKTRREQISNGDYPDDSDDYDSEDDSASENGGGAGRVVVNQVPPVEWRCGDLLRDEIDERWDLVLDKGTFDALCLSDEPVQEAEGRPPSLVYPERIARLVQKGGFFLITSCNFTEEEVKRRWTKPGLGFEFHSSVPHPSFTFGGKKGSTVCTVAFKKVD